jgi:hypothetical protein
MKDDLIPLIKELASAVSIQVQVSNRHWIALATLSLIALLPRDPSPTFALPFGLGSVPPDAFYLALFGLLAVMSLAFSSAHAQSMRATRMAHKALNELDKSVLVGVVRGRDLFDMMRHPSLIRVAPLAQLFGELGARAATPRIWRRRLAAAYYFALKVPSWAVYFLLPAVALWHTAVRIQVRGPSRWILLGVAGLATVPLVQILAVDITYGRDIGRILSKPEHPNKPLQPTSGAAIVG